MVRALPFQLTFAELVKLLPATFRVNEADPAEATEGVRVDNDGPVTEVPPPLPPVLFVPVDAAGPAHPVTHESKENVSRKNKGRQIRTVKLHKRRMLPY